MFYPFGICSSMPEQEKVKNSYTKTSYSSTKKHIEETKMLRVFTKIVKCVAYETKSYIVLGFALIGAYFVKYLFKY